MVQEEKYNYITPEVLKNIYQDVYEREHKALKVINDYYFNDKYVEFAKSEEVYGRDGKLDKAFITMTHGNKTIKAYPEFLISDARPTRRYINIGEIDNEFHRLLLHNRNDYDKRVKELATEFGYKEEKITGAFQYPNKVILYVNNIMELAKTDYEFKTCLDRTIVHELVHFVHYQFIKLIGQNYWGSRKLPDARTTVIECLAKWMEYRWLCEEFRDERRAKQTILDELFGRIYPFYPYAAARVYIEREKNPAKLLRISATSWEDAYKQILKDDDRI